MPTNIPQSLRDYRTILKHLKKLPSASNNQLIVNVKRKFRLDSKESNENVASNNRKIARSYALLSQCQSQLKFLRGLDTGEKLDQREKIRQTASRVGLQVPNFLDEDYNSVTSATKLSNF